MLVTPGQLLETNKRSPQGTYTASILSRVGIESLFNRLKDNEIKVNPGVEQPKYLRRLGEGHQRRIIVFDAAGRRVLGVGIDASWQEIYDALKEEPAFPGVPKGNPGSVNRPVYEPEEWDTSYTRELLGRDFIGIRETFRETEAYYQGKGWSFMN
ncbi:hypothetical protein BDV93DRAFT_545609 [Ceratobasidium sp. AG-I]|nr:hypothetical protein BDV93DRAFT_545609 [Ceratobasidium sp. AG-I]